MPFIDVTLVGIVMSVARGESINAFEPIARKFEGRVTMVACLIGRLATGVNPLISTTVLSLKVSGQWNSVAFAII